MRKQRKKRPILDRLYQRVKIPLTDTGERDKTQCWIWHGVVNNAGYGMLKVDSEINMATAHRIVMVEEKKLINYGDKVEVLHDCGNKLCVNPDHLILGDIKDRTRLQIKYGNVNSITFNNRKVMWPVCEHCGETDYLPHFKRLHRLCERNAKHKYFVQSISGKK